MDGVIFEIFTVREGRAGVLYGGGWDGMGVWEVRVLMVMVGGLWVGICYDFYARVFQGWQLLVWLDIQILSTIHSPPFK